MNVNEVRELKNTEAASGFRPIKDAELDDINGGFLFLLVGVAEFGTGFFAGYGAQRFAQDMSD